MLCSGKHKHALISRKAPISLYKNSNDVTCTVTHSSSGCGGFIDACVCVCAGEVPVLAVSLGVSLLVLLALVVGGRMCWTRRTQPAKRCIKKI